ncbi:hypothetical protein HanPI659440_Chr08g0306931 [Helianthus annuus]|nr:hypothetical protein HanPI659440_Chr08g0306931 [Helianthus annuus]
MVSSLGVWKDRFFWVSDEIVPFKMVWRHPDAVLNEPEPSALEINTCFLETIRECPSRVRPFPEPLLMLLGISKLRDKPDRDPVLMRNDQVMSALDFVKSDDTSDVMFGDAAATPGEDAVARGSEHWFEGFGYVSKGGVEKEKEKELVVAEKKKKLVKKGVVPAIQGSSGKSVGDSFKDPAVCGDVLANFAPLGVRDAISEMEGDHFISRLMLSSCNLSALLAEGVTRFRKGMQEYEEVTKKKDKMKASMASMKKEIDGFAKKEKAWVREKTSMKEKEVLKADNRWLIEHGFQQVVTYLLHSSEFNQALGAVYKACEAGEPQDKSPLFQPQALKVFQDSVRDMEHMTWPFVGEVSECFDKPLSVLQGLKPRGLNEVVCKKVLESLSKKRSCSGSSEETMSAGDEASKEGSLEASEAASEGQKKKNAKKSKDDGAGASKPSSAGFAETLKVSIDGC